ncbi:hypothetical protein HX057_13980 [Myroides odoratimimus]|uniref:Lipoprotein n=1 Tax=Myroides odoratimimus CIP 101113 TaxID=883154 RepID=A0AAV3F650_9FLAO|nr:MULTISPECIES: hypothetical protein [Myroides]AJA69105.1 hypothetical protein MYRA21_1969 [Myroides sp. A21]EHO13299.1 hypothetical protein HMPREF9714_00856 [Myroides odoratimimus CCUG 12901]EHO14188.1 hypothetical protein HMPREF9715_00859 [Myroides odoratimimus CIP 101113]EPH11534.1 hypothetical protein HMPREF9713_02024 [Myroides odoratimimus CCUG 12700]MDM1064309.1 hypothetical protein [Myroides odoratimimus]
MKKIYLFLLGLSLSLQSCVTKEEMYVKDNGAVDYTFKMDFKELLQNVPDKNAIFKGDAEKLELISGQELSIDQILDFAMLKEKNGEQKKDSIIKANKELFDNTKNVRFMINMKDSLADFNLKVIAKDMADLNQSLININKITDKTSELDKKQNGKKQPPLLVESQYSLDSKQFERKVSVKDTEEAKKANEMGGMEAMFTYVLKTSFDKKIKSVSYEDAVISKDGKSFEKRFSMSDIIANPKVLEYKVEFK